MVVTRVDGREVRTVVSFRSYVGQRINERFFVEVDVSNKLVNDASRLRLSISGSQCEFARNGRLVDVGGGQNVESFRLLARGAAIGHCELGEGRTVGALRRLIDVWERWHLNDVRAGCVHQRAMGWKACGRHYGQKVVYADPIAAKVVRSSQCDLYSRPDRSLSARVIGGADRSDPIVYHEAGRHYWYEEGASVATYCDNKVGVSCPECGYRYGTSWLYEPLPDDVLAFLSELAATVNQAPAPRR